MLIGNAPRAIKRPSYMTKNDIPPIKIIILYAVHQGDDEISSGSPRWWFTSHEKATQVANGRGWYGGNAPISEHLCLQHPANGMYYELKTSIPFDINLLDIGPEQENKVKETALAKLTSYERKVLGL